jgi:eukaryotic-like serine/threonine-protein kinase
VTNEGVILGTAHYMSPEQARGRPVDKRSDIWAFGCVLYEMVTGRNPFNGETSSDVVAAILEHDPDWTALPADVPKPLSRLIRRCLEKNAKLRLRDIGDAFVALEEARSPDGSTRDINGTFTHTRERLVWSVALLGVAAIAAVFATLNRDAESPPVFSRAIRLTSGPGLEFGPAISPDGKWSLIFPMLAAPRIYGSSF